MTLRINASLLPRLLNVLWRWRVAGGQQGAREDARRLGGDSAASTQDLLRRVRSTFPPGTPMGSVTQKPRPEARVLQGGQR